MKIGLFVIGAKYIFGDSRLYFYKSDGKPLRSKFLLLIFYLFSFKLIIIKDIQIAVLAVCKFGNARLGEGAFARQVVFSGSSCRFIPVKQRVMRKPSRNSPLAT